MVEHLSTVHIVTVDDGYLVVAGSKGVIVAFIKEQRAVFVVVFVKIVFQIITVVAAVHHRIVNLQKVSAGGFVGQPCAKIAVFRIQILHRLAVLFLGAVQSLVEGFLQPVVQLFVLGRDPNSVVDQIHRRADQR